MKDIQNNKTIGVIAALAFVVGLVTLCMAFFSNGETTSAETKKSMFQIAGLLLALAVILFILMLQIKRRKKNKKNRYHPVHWENGKVTRE